MRALSMAGSRVLLGLAAALAMAPAPGAAHTKERPLREIVVVRGTVRPGDAACAERVVLRALNRDVQLCDGAVRRVAVAAPETADQQTPAAFELQGERPSLAALTGAAPGARINVVGEWRPGRSDLFLIEIDVFPCPDERPEGNREKE